MPLFSRKHSRPGGHIQQRNSSRYCCILLTFISIIFLYRLYQSSGIHTTRTDEHLPGVSSGAALAVLDGAKCISWRQTDHCTPSGCKIHPKLTSVIGAMRTCLGADLEPCLMWGQHTAGSDVQMRTDTATTGLTKGLDIANVPPIVLSEGVTADLACLTAPLTSDTFPRDHCT